MRRAFCWQVVVTVAIFASLIGCGGGGGGASTGSNGGGGGNPVVPQLQITTTTLPDAIVNTSYSATLAVSGGTAPYRWTLNTNVGLNLDASTGVLSGTPSFGGGLFNLSVSVTDSTGRSGSALVPLYIARQLGLQFSNWGATRFSPFSVNPGVFGGKPPYSIALTSGALPPGIQLTGFSAQNGSFQISGTPTAAGTYTFAYTATDSTSPTPQTASSTGRVIVDTRIFYSQINLPIGIVGRSYSGSLTFFNATLPLHWSNLPPGVTADDAGNFTGVATSAGFFNPTFLDSSTPPQFSPSSGLQIVNPLQVPRGGIAQIRVGQNISVVPQLAGGVQPVNFSLQSGSLPPGMSFSAVSPSFGNGIVGTPAQAGTYVFGVHAIDSASPPETYDEPYTIVVLPPLPSVQFPATVPAAVLGHPYSLQFSASGGTPPYAWSVSGAPGGLAIDSSGNLSGVPTTTAGGLVTVTVTDSANPAQSAATSPFSILVHAKPLGRNDSLATASILPFGETSGLSISPYSDGTPNVSDSDYFKGYANAGAILNVSANRTGNSALDPVIEILDANGQRFQTCNDPALKTPPPPVIADTSWGNYTDDCVNDDVDVGVNINSHLDFKVPGASGTQVPFYLHVLDQQGNARPDMTYYLDVFGQIFPLSLTQLGNPASIGVPYSAQIGAQGGTGAATIQLAQGSSLPPGLSMNGSGQITGTPTTAGNYTYDVMATDSGNPPQQTTNTFSISVADALAVAGKTGTGNNTTLPQGATGVAYSTKIAVTGGVPPYSYSFFSGSWCACLTFDRSTGTISGIPDAPVSYTAGLNVSDSQGRFASTNLTLPISAGPLYVANSTLPGATVGAVYDELIPVRGGAPGYSFAVTGGAVPPGMTFDNTVGNVRGIPSASGTYSFTVQITDSSAVHQTISVQITITVQ